MTSDASPGSGAALQFGEVSAGALFRRLGHDLRDAAAAGGCSLEELHKWSTLAGLGMQMERPEAAVHEDPPMPWIELVESALEDVRWLATRRSIRFEWSLAEGVESRLIEAPSAVHAAIASFLEESVLAHDGPDTINLRADVVENQATLVIEGVSWPTPTARPERSAAMGRLVLAAAAALLERAKGHFEWAQGDGRALRLVIPARRETAPAAPPSDERRTTGDIVLVVDDNVDAARTLALSLSTFGIATREVHHGQRALEEAVAPEVGTVLLDLGLPDIDGFEVARRIRGTLGRDDVMLVAVSGYGDAAARQRARDAGFDHHFVKPVDESDLLTVLQKQNEP